MTFNAALKRGLVVAVFVVVLFACRNGYTQPVFLRGERTRGVGRDRAGRIVGAIEVEHDRAVGHRTSLQEPATGISISLAGGIAEDEEQATRGVAAQIGEPQLLAIEFENCGPGNRGWGDIAQHVGNIDRLLAV